MRCTLCVVFSEYKSSCIVTTVDNAYYYKIVDAGIYGE